MVHGCLMSFCIQTEKTSYMIRTVLSTIMILTSRLVTEYRDQSTVSIFNRNLQFETGFCCYYRPGCDFTRPMTFIIVNRLCVSFAQTNQQLHCFCPICLWNQSCARVAKRTIHTNDSSNAISIETCSLYSYATVWYTAFVASKRLTCLFLMQIKAQLAGN